MPETHSELILIRTCGIETRDNIIDALSVETLSHTLELFVSHMEAILERTPLEIKKFQLAEFSVSAEVTAEGKFVILGAGIEAGASGGITFKFKRKEGV